MACTHDLYSPSHCFPEPGRLWTFSRVPNSDLAAEQRQLTAAALAVGCSRAAYADQSAARLGLAKLIGKKPFLSGTRVYPCDICPACHLTSKNSGKKTALGSRSKLEAYRRVNPARSFDVREVQWSDVSWHQHRALRSRDRR
jgi:hypothetical protein